MRHNNATQKQQRIAVYHAPLSKCHFCLKLPSKLQQQHRTYTTRLLQHQSPLRGDNHVNDYVCRCGEFSPTVANHENHRHRRRLNKKWKAASGSIWRMCVVLFYWQLVFCHIFISSGNSNSSGNDNDNGNPQTLDAVSHLSRKTLKQQQMKKEKQSMLRMRVAHIWHYWHVVSYCCCCCCNNALLLIENSDECSWRVPCCFSEVTDHQKFWMTNDWQHLRFMKILHEVPMMLKNIICVIRLKCWSNK